MVLMRRETLVRPEHRMFALYDPTVDDSDDFRPATVEAIASTVGWAPSVLAVSTVLDLVRTTVRVAVWNQRPEPDDVPETANLPEPDLTRSGTLAFPSGRYSIDMSVDDDFRLGLDLPDGPGSYKVQVRGYHRAEVRQRRDAAYAGPPGPGCEAAIDALDRLETYQFDLWKVSDHPRWEPDDE